MKKKYYAVICTFIAILTILVVCSLFIDSDGFSPLKTGISAKACFYGIGFLFREYMDMYETFLLDNFLLRELSVMSFQSYSNLLYLDLFTDSELVLANVDVDEFVRAGGQEGVTDAEAGTEQQDGTPGSDAGAVSGQEGSSGNPSDSMTQEGSGQTDGAQLSPGAGQGGDDGSDQGQTDDGQAEGQDPAEQQAGTTDGQDQPGQESKETIREQEVALQNKRLMNG